MFAQETIRSVGVLFLLGVATTMAIAADEGMQQDLVYATVGDKELKLDLYRPAAPAQDLLIVWIHGGAWRAGSKSDMPLGALVDAGFAVASVDYRLSPEAPFPAQAHDIKAALRLLRARQKELHIQADRIVVAGSSAGGHLAALIGTSNGNKDLEGNLGEFHKTSSQVQGIVSFYGMSNLTTILAQSTPHGLKVRIPALQLLLGGQPEDKLELARLASPVFHVTANSPPLLLIHGDQDPQAPINQAHELQGKYEAAGAPCEFVVLHGSGHGGKEFYNTTQMDRVKKFLADLPIRSDSSAKLRR